MSTPAKIDFWDKKILEWEESRYSSKIKIASSSVLARFQLAKIIISQSPPLGHLEEWGCGSGLFANELSQQGLFESYQGHDISTAAIEKARQRKIPHANFKATSNIPPLEDHSKTNLIFSLGLLDWLDKKELQQLIERSQDRFFLHSFSEKRNSFSQLLHRSYTYLYYGRKNGGYTPIYHTVDELIPLFNKKNDLKIIRSSKMRFGSFITNLPITELKYGDVQLI